MEEKKRKGYKTSRQQVEANKRYLAKHPEKKKKTEYPLANLLAKSL